MLIKSRKAKTSLRGIYIQDKELIETNFSVGSHYSYKIDLKNRKVIIEKSNNSFHNTVSKRTTKIGQKPVIDIRKKDVLQTFESCSYLKVHIYEDKVIIEGYEDEGNLAVNESVLTKIKGKVLNFKKKVRASKPVINKVAVLSKDEFTKASGDAFQLSLDFNWSTEEDSSQINSYVKGKESSNLHIALEVASLFSGAGTMDYPFMNQDFLIKFAIDNDQHAVETYRHNISDHIVLADMSTFDVNSIPKVPIIIGGPPCTPFSNSNRRLRMLDHPKNVLLKRFIKAVKANDNCKVFVLENVPQLLTGAGGAFKDEIHNELSDFEITTGILSAKDYGDPQDRKRAIIIGSKIGRIDLPSSTHNHLNYKLVQDAFYGLTDGIPNQMDYSKARPETIERMKYIPPGGNWTSLPEHLKSEKMLKGNTHSVVFRRLEMNKPSITIINPRKNNILHPLLNRILSVRECARLFSLPDNYRFLGTLSSMQQQVCNGVPVKMIQAVAQNIKQAIMQFNIRNKSQSLSLV